MEEVAEQLKNYLVQEDIQAAQTMIGNLIHEYEWKEIVGVLKIITKSLYRQHLLKIHHMVLSIFNLSELLGVDCDLFSEMVSIPHPKSLEHASNLLFDNLIQIVKTQLKSGGSTLFFNVEKIKTTRSIVLISDLIEARYRETIFILAEIDEQIHTQTKEWINVARLWRIGYGLRILKARNHGLLIHAKEYKEIRNRMMNELGIKPDGIYEERERLIRESNSAYLQLSDTLDTFILSYITSLGIRGKFEPKYKSLIDHEGLDEF